MDTLSIKEKPFPDITLKLESPSQLNLTYEVLKQNDEKLILESAKCFAEAFSGTDIS